MRFDPHPQKFRFDARRRIITLCVFAVVVVGVLVSLKREPSMFPSDPEYLELPDGGPEMVVGPGEARVQIRPPGSERETSDGDTLTVPGGELDPLPPNQDPQPFKESPETLQQAAGSDFTAHVPSTPLAYLFQKIRTDAHWTNDGQLTSTAEQNRLWKILETDAAAARGTQFMLEGVLISSDRRVDPLEIFGLPADNPSGLNRYYRGYLFTGTKLFLVAVCDPPERPFEDRDRVRVRASFMHVYANEIEKDGRLEKRAIPFLVGRSFTPVVVNPGTSFHVAWLPYVVIGLIGAFAIALIVVQIIMSRGDVRVDRRVRRLKSSLARHAAQARKSSSGLAMEGATPDGEEGT